jgi:hypothetical protein
VPWGGFFFFAEQTSMTPTVSQPKSSPTGEQPDAPPSATGKPWEMQPGEPNVWYDRFWTFLMLGAGRTIEECYRERTEQGERLKGDRATGYWYRMAREYRWEDRAVAYDKARREDLQAREEERRIQERERRRRMVSDVLEGCYTALKAANLGAMEEADARRALPTLRALFHDAIQAFRLEMGEPTSIDQVKEESALAITADDLAKAQQDLMQMYGVLPVWKGGAGGAGPDAAAPVATDGTSLGGPS